MRVRQSSLAKKCGGAKASEHFFRTRETAAGLTQEHPNFI
jgi:hypothetical protein